MLLNLLGEMSCMSSKVLYVDIYTELQDFNILIRHNFTEDFIEMSRWASVATSIELKCLICGHTYITTRFLYDYKSCLLQKRPVF